MQLASATHQSTSSTGPKLPSVLCCMCGVPIQPNTANQCATCLASSSDVTKGISTEATLHQCRGCQRWHKSEGQWIASELESRELMTLCLQHVSGLKQSGVRLTDAAWIWTEPHSMRLKVRLTIQREVQTGTILQQSFVVTYVVRNQQCIECQAVFRQGSWKSLVQVRQRVQHKRTFLYLEQLILKHGAHRGCLSIETFRDGMDFYFPDKGRAARFISFLENAVPVKIKTSKKLIGTDDKSNVSNYKYTNYVEICPLCKDDLLCLPHKTAQSLGSIARVVLVKNISNVIHLIDPLSGQTATLSNEAYWRSPIRPIITAARSRLTCYVVLGKEAVFLRPNAAQRATKRQQRSKLAALTLAQEADLGVNDHKIEDQRSHLGYLMKCGDVCLGYDLQETQFVDDEAEALREAGRMPPVVVVRKLYGGSNRESAAAKRVWRLERLPVKAGEEQQQSTRRKAVDANTDDMDEEDFMQEVEADKDMRLNMNLYKNDTLKKTSAPSADEDAMDDDDDEEEEDEDDDQRVKLDELLDGLALDAGPDDEEDAPPQRFFAEGEKAASQGLTYVARGEARHVRDKDTAIAVSSLGKEYQSK